MEIVFTLSDDVVIPLLTEWLNCSDVLRLDIACTFSKQSHESLRRFFAMKQVVFDSPAKFFARDVHKSLEWLLNRQIKCAKLEIMSGMVAGSPLLDKYIALCGPALRSLRFCDYSDKMMATAMKFCTGIKDLSINGGGDIDENSVLFSESVEIFHLNSEFAEMNSGISIEFPNLNNLHIVGSGVSDAVFVGILQSTSKIQQLYLEDVPSLTKTSYAAVSQYCKSLERLFIFDFPFQSAFLENILPFTPQLTVLSLFNLDGGVNPKEVFDGVASNCPSLTELVIANSHSEQSAAALRAFSQMLSRCPLLRILSLESCSFVNDDYLLAIATKATQIKDLCLLSCDVTDTGLAEIAKHCTQLECLSLITGGGFSISANCHELFRKETTVDITNLDDLWDFGDGGGGGESSEDDDDDDSEEDDSVNDDGHDDESDDDNDDESGEAEEL